MSFLWVVVAYALALALALYLLFHFKAQTWYWHLLSVALALGIGLMPPRPDWQGPVWDLIFGSTFLLLLVWGLGGFLTYGTHTTHHKHA